MSDIQIDRSRADADRRMRLLEMAKGDLEQARRLERWVQGGDFGPLTAKPLTMDTYRGIGIGTDKHPGIAQQGDGMDIPDFLKAKPRA